MNISQRSATVLNVLHDLVQHCIKLSHQNIVIKCKNTRKALGNSIMQLIEKKIIMPTDVVNYVLGNAIDDDVLVNMTSTPNNVKTLSGAFEATREEMDSNKSASEIVVNLMDRICEADRKNPDLLSGLLDLCDTFVVRKKNECDCDVILDSMRGLLGFRSSRRMNAKLMTSLVRMSGTCVGLLTSSAFNMDENKKSEFEMLLDEWFDFLFSSFNRYKFEWQVRQQVALSLATCGKNLVNFVFAADKGISLRVSKSSHDVTVSGSNKTQVVSLSCAINLLVDDNYQVRHHACKFSCDVTKQLSSDQNCSSETVDEYCDEFVLESLISSLKYS